jgi:hypothetical protein
MSNVFFETEALFCATHCRLLAASTVTQPDLNQPTSGVKKLPETSHKARKVKNLWIQSLASGKPDGVK